MAAFDPRSKPSPITTCLVWFHRWLGVVTCLIFALWFASGAVLLFKPFPSFPHEEQLELQQPIDTPSIAITASQAVAAARIDASGLRLITRAGRPAYLVENGQRIVVIDARSGQALPLLRPRDVGATGPAIAYDQWIVHNQYDRFRPFYRINTDGKTGTEVYVSAVTGEVMQRTRRSDRAWNWVGAVLHWAYFTPLRSSFTGWDRSVWTLSFVAMLVALAGVVLGVMRTAISLRQRKPSLSYFRARWLRWHHVLGLIAGPFVFCWILSGWLSMDHGRLFSRGQPSSSQALAFKGLPLGAGLRDTTPAALVGIPDAREIVFSLVGGQTIITIYAAGGRVVRLDAAGHELGNRAFAARLADAVAFAWPGIRLQSVSQVKSTDLYANAEGWPPSALRLLTTRTDTDLYVDGNTGQLLTVMNRSRAAYAWIYYALHTFKIPVLIPYPLVRQGLALVPLIGGFVFSITGVVIGWRRLRRSLWLNWRCP